MWRRCAHFGNFMETKNLHDLGFCGPSFTWQRGRVYERLDRAIGNEAWCQIFPKCLVTNLVRIKSDHRPLLMELCPDLKLSKERPFVFLAG